MPRRNAETPKAADQANKRKNRTTSFRFAAEPLESRVLLNSAAARLKSATARNSATLDPALQATTAPYIVSINRQSPGTVSTGATGVQFLATFSQPVTGVDASDFAISSDSAVTVTNPLVLAPVTAATYNITLSGIKGSGDLSVKLIDNHDIVNASGQHLVSMSPTNVLSSPQNSSSPLLNYPADVVADLNGDRKADFIQVAGSGASVSFGDGMGNFNYSTYLAVQVTFGVQLAEFTTGDVNGDHVPDVVLIYQDGTIASFLGTGNGNFSGGQVTATSISSPSRVSIADFNGDGHSDILVETSSGDDSIALGVGNGTFTVNSTVSLAQFSSVTPADLNGDNIADLLVSNSAGVSIRMNDGSGHFGQSIAVTNLPAGIFAGPTDFNGDGKLDVAYVDSNGTTHLLTGNGDGTFSPATSFPSTSGFGIPMAFDANGDGLPDLLILDGNTSMLLLALNNGAGQFQQPHAIASGLTNAALQSVDLNGDGSADLVATNIYANLDEILYGVADVAFSSQPYAIAQPAPQIVSLQPSAATAPLNATSVQYTLTFSQNVSGVNASEFPTTTQGVVAVSGPITVTPVSGSVYTVTVNGIHGEGTVNLTFSDTTNVHNAFGQTLVSQLPGFSPSSVVPTDFTPEFLADINEDGNVDLIGPSRATGAVEIAYGNGDGTFQSPFVVGGATGEYQVLAVGDVTVDGAVDLVVVDSGTLEALPNNGHGDFAAPIVLGTVGAYSAVIGDFNNDRMPDIVANTGNGFVTFIGTGGGHFRQTATSAADSTASYILADVNSDGSLDQLTFGQDANPDVFVGNGDGSFSKPMAVPDTTTSSARGVFADVNKDGILDDIYAYNNILGYRPGMGDGTFGSFIALTSATAYPTVLAVADFNGDGAIDVLTQTNDGNFSLYTGNLAGSSPQVINLGSARAFNPGILVGDFNHDGKADWIVTSAVSGTSLGYVVETNAAKISCSAAVSVEQTYPHIVSLVKNSSQQPPGVVDYMLTFSEPVTGISAAAFSAVVNGSVTAGPIGVTSQSASIYEITIRDVSGSGTIALSFNDTNVVRDTVGNPLLSNDTDNAFTQINVNGVGSQGVVVAGDLNNDGKADIVASDFDTYAALGNGDGTFQPGIRPGVGIVSKLITVDVNNDGKLDLISTANFQQIDLAFGNGDGTFGAAPAINGNNTWDNCEVADINGDGQVDIVAISSSRHQIATLLGTGTGAFSAPIITSLNSASVTSISVGDVNGDGVPDALVTCQGVGAYILIGHRDGTFTMPATPFLADVNLQLGRLADFNADQKLDVIVSGVSGSHVLLGNGDGSFSADHPFAAMFNTSIPVADLNGDGFPDLIIPTFGGQGMVYVGIGDGTFKSPVVESSLSFTEAVAVADFNGDGRPDMFTGDFLPSDDVMFLARNGSTISAPSIVGSVSQSNVVTTAVSGITLTRDSDGIHIDWVAGSLVGQVAIGSASGLTINAAATMTSLQLNWTGGNPLPQALHLNGTFTLNGFIGSNPLANTNLDINASTLFITYANPAVDPFGTIRNNLKSGYNAGLWNGVPTATTGVITSTTAAGNWNHNTAIGYADSRFGLVPLPANTIELKYSLYGDTGLTGSVGFTDFMRMTQHYTRTGSGNWGTGDFNYDGDRLKRLQSPPTQLRPDSSRPGDDSHHRCGSGDVRAAAAKPNYCGACRRTSGGRRVDFGGVGRFGDGERSA